MSKITVSICTYNGELRLPKVFNYLANQVNVNSKDWEILVVDNASKDNTPQIVEKYQKDFEEICNVRYVVERKQGLAFARARAVKEANTDLVAFVDDDNLLFPDWVDKAIIFAELHPNAGAFGGQIHGKFESEPPDYLGRIKMFLAIIERGTVAHEYSPEKRMLPPGAGLVVRKDAWLSHVPENLSLSGRIGKSMLSGEDLEALVYIQKANWTIWYNPKMELYHDIPNHRLEEEYLMKLAWGIGLSRNYIRFSRYNFKQKILLTPLHVFNDFRKLLSYLFKVRFKTNKKSIRFEATYRLATFLSIFYSMKRWMATLPEKV
ncbi:MAG: hormogonium polysaccharide biosynthesis glycosyltransferase HpsE [Cyanobacteria bacterium P01_D01_bin.71]